MELGRFTDTNARVYVGILGLWVVFVFSVWFCFGNSILTPLNIAASSILTAGLVLLYLKQTQITQDQVDIMMLQYEPDLTIEDRAAEGDTAFFELKNQGSGSAIGVRIDVGFSLNESDEMLSSDLKRVDDPNVHSNVLQPLESGIYTADLSLKLPDRSSNKDAIPFSEAAKLIQDDERSAMNMTYTIKYANAVGEKGSETENYVFNLREDGDELENYFGKAVRRFPDLDIQ